MSMPISLGGLARNCAARRELAGQNQRRIHGHQSCDPIGDQAFFLDDVARYNAAVMTNVPFNPNVKDGRGTSGLAMPKSNWGNILDEAPFEAYQVDCGITFTFGRLRIVPSTGRVLDTDHAPIPGLYAAGELVGGLFYFNYPWGTDLISGSVFGRTAGAAAA